MVVCAFGNRGRYPQTPFFPTGCAVCGASAQLPVANLIRTSGLLRGAARGAPITTSSNASGADRRQVYSPFKWKL